MKKYIIAIDEGTTSTRCVLFNTLENKIVDNINRKFKQYYPANGWVEHDAEEIWNNVKKNLYDIIDNNHLKAEDIFSIGITNQRETVVAWNKKTGKPICKAIVWQCRRTAKYCHSLSRKTKDMIKSKTGLILDSYFSGTKMRWILKNVPEAKELSKKHELCFGTIDSFLCYKLTRGKVFATDSSNASRTLLTDLKAPMVWDDDMTKLFGIPKSSLPEIKNSADDFGQAKTKIGEIPICSMIGDQQSSLFGQGCYEPNDAKNTYGTGAFLLVNTGDKIIPENKKLLSTVAWTIDGKPTYAIEGSVFNVGSSVNFLKEKLNMFNDLSELDQICDSLKSNEGVYFLPAFTGLGAPHWRPNARGTILGLTLASTKNHVVRACFESFAYSINDIIDYLKSIGIKIHQLSVDGGVSKTNFLLQFQADILNAKVSRVKNSESTSLGTIFLSGLKSGAYNSLAEIKEKIKQDKTFEPKMDEQTRKKNIEGWKNFFRLTPA